MIIQHEIIMIQSRRVSKWNNGLSGYFEYDQVNTKHHFIEVDCNFNNLLEKVEDQMQRRPICTGFISFLIQNIEKVPLDIYESYLKQAELKYINDFKYSPMAHTRNLPKQFLDVFFDQESLNILNSSNIYQFIDDDTSAFLNGYLSGFESFLKKQKAVPNIQDRSLSFSNLGLHRFNIRENQQVMKKQYQLLLSNGFVNCDEELFLYRMGFNETNGKFEKIRWIVKNKKSSEPNKKSLIDYLTIIGIKEQEIKNKINTIFEIPGGEKYASNNYEYDKGILKTKSEYHIELVKIVNESKQN